MTIDICLVEFLLRLLILFSDIISFILLSLSVYNKNHHHFCCDSYNAFDEHYARYHHDPLKIAIRIAMIIWIIIKW
jgi:hypothetical protein